MPPRKRTDQDQPADDQVNDTAAAAGDAADEPNVVELYGADAYEVDVNEAPDNPTPPFPIVLRDGDEKYTFLCAEPSNGQMMDAQACLRDEDFRGFFRHILLEQYAEAKPLLDKIRKREHTAGIAGAYMLHFEVDDEIMESIGRSLRQRVAGNRAARRAAGK